LNLDLTATVAVAGVEVEVCRNIVSVFGEVMFETELRSQVFKFAVAEIVDEVIGRKILLDLLHGYICLPIC